MVTEQVNAEDEAVIELTLVVDGQQTLVTWEERGMPVEYLAGYGAARGLASSRCSTGARVRLTVPLTRITMGA